MLAARQTVKAAAQIAPRAPRRPLTAEWLGAFAPKAAASPLGFAAVTEPFLGAMPAPLLTFEGLDAKDNEDVFFMGYYPPDANGDIGPNHYVEMINTLYRVYDRQGNPLTPPLKLSALFQVLGGVAAEYDDGDPIVLYDHLADRWLLSQFVVSPWPDAGRAHQAIAISQTGDPTGAYYVYDFEMPNNTMNDYPVRRLAAGLLHTDNQFNPGPDYAAAGSGVFAFDRRRMLAGDPTASYCFVEEPDYFGLLPADLDGAVRNATSRALCLPVVARAGPIQPGRGRGRVRGFPRPRHPG